MILIKNTKRSRSLRQKVDNNDKKSISETPEKFLRMIQLDSLVVVVRSRHQDVNETN